MPQSGEKWNQFTLLDPLGKGGMGEIFLAEDQTLNRKVALKFLPESLRTDEIARERFLREARAAASLDHPYICKIYEIGEVEKTVFIAMEYLEGETLEDKLQRGALPTEELTSIAIELVEAVDAAHRNQILHRDLKSANVMVTRDGHVKVLDFGLAKHVMLDVDDSQADTASARLTHQGTTPGTVLYMSPEQVRGEELDARSDIFSVGILLFEMATGTVPFQGATSGLTYDAILNRGAPPPRELNPDVPTELEQIIEKALEKDREIRYQTAKDLLVDLKRLRRDSDTGTLAFADLEAKRPAEPERSLRRTVLLGLLGLAAVGVVGLLLLRPPSIPVPGDGLPIDSLAVLPFENTRDDPEVGYLSDGIAESLINQLSQLPQLSVKARSTSFRFRGRDVDPHQVGEELEVGAVLTGRVVLQEDKLNVQAELVETGGGTQVWGQQYEREIKDLLQVQNDLASEISRALRLELTGADEIAIATRGTLDSAAYRAYLRGRFLWAKRTNEDFKRAITYYERALEIDPSYALAYAGLADCYFLLGAQFYGVDADYPPDDAIAQARAAALEALRLDDRLAEPRATLGFIRFARDWDWAGAEEEFLVAIENDPAYGTARQWYSLFLSSTQRYDEALEQARRAVEIDPTSPLTNRLLGGVLAQAGRLEEAVEQWEHTLELGPSSFTSEWLAHAHWVDGNPDGAIEVVRRESEELARFYELARDGDVEEARRVLDALPDELRSGRNAVRYAIVDDFTKIEATLDAWAEERSPNLAVLFNDPLLIRYRERPEIIAIRERIGLPN